MKYKTKSGYDMCYYSFYHSGIPLNFQSADLFTDFKDRQDIIDKYITFLNPKNNKPWIYISGNTGVGKTHLSAAIYHDLFTVIKSYRGMSGHFLSVNDMIDMIKVAEDFNTKESVRDVIDGYSYGNPLFIDDLGRENPSNYTVEKLDQIINKRYENHCLTIINSNLNLDELAYKYNDDRISRRISELAVIIEL